VLVSPPEGAEISSGTPLTFAWNTGSTETTSILVNIEQHVPNVYWIEAEDAF
jgi:hypothetical protein